MGYRVRVRIRFSLGESGPEESSSKIFKISFVLSAPSMKAVNSATSTDPLLSVSITLNRALRWTSLRVEGGIFPLLIPFLNSSKSRQPP